MKLENQINNLIAEEMGDSDISPFSSSGFDVYLKSITSYTMQLFNLSSFLSKKNELDLITASIVKQASEKIHRSKNDKLLNIILSLAGLLLGSGITHLITILNTNTIISNESLMFITFSVLIGAFLFGLYLFK